MRNNAEKCKFLEIIINFNLQIIQILALFFQITLIDKLRLSYCYSQKNKIQCLPILSILIKQIILLMQYHLQSEKLFNQQKVSSAIFPCIKYTNLKIKRQSDSKKIQTSNKIKSQINSQGTKILLQKKVSIDEIQRRMNKLKQQQCEVLIKKSAHQENGKKTIYESINSQIIKEKQVIRQKQFNQSKEDCQRQNNQRQIKNRQDQYLERMKSVKQLILRRHYNKNKKLKQKRINSNIKFLSEEHIVQQNSFSLQQLISLKSVQMKSFMNCKINFRDNSSGRKSQEINNTEKLVNQTHQQLINLPQEHPNLWNSYQYGQKKISIISLKKSIKIPIEDDIQEESNQISNNPKLVQESNSKTNLKNNSKKQISDYIKQRRVRIIENKKTKGSIVTMLTKKNNTLLSIGPVKCHQPHQFQEANEISSKNGSTKIYLNGKDCTYKDISLSKNIQLKKGMDQNQRNKQIDFPVEGWSGTLEIPKTQNQITISNFYQKKETVQISQT